MTKPKTKKDMANMSKDIYGILTGKPVDEDKIRLIGKILADKFSSESTYGINALSAIGPYRCSRLNYQGIFREWEVSKELQAHTLEIISDSRFS